MLNRVLNLARRQKPQAFTPRKRAMATTCFGHAQADDAELATFVVDAVPPGAPLFAVPARPAAAPHATSSGAPASGAPSSAADLPGLALGQMRLALEDGLLMVFGPEDDPVPPQAFAAAAAAQPDAPLGLPDGTSAPAARVAEVLRAQASGGLAAAGQTAEWVLAMLRAGPRPEEASEAALRAEQEMPREPDGPTGAALESEATGEAPDQAVLDPAASIEASLTAWPQPEPAAEPLVVEPLEVEPPDVAPLDVEPVEIEPLAASADAALDLDFSDRVDLRVDEPAELPLPGDVADPWQADVPPAAQGAAAGAPEGDLPWPAADPAPWVPDEPAGAAEAGAERSGVDPDSMVLVLMRGVPDDARLSAGSRDDDGTWSISPLDLATVMISLASAPSDAGALAARSGDLSITGIGFADDGELVAISETVPLADYLDDPTAGEPAPPRQPPQPAATAGESRQRAIPLELDLQALADETIDALVVRDLPAGARLSAGAYDPTIKGWVLRPQDLRALAIVPAPELRADFTLTLLGIALRPGAKAARVLARLPISLA